MAPSTGNRVRIIGLSRSGEDYAEWKSFFAEIFLAKGWREKEKIAAAIHTLYPRQRRSGNSATGMSVALTVVKPGGFMNRLLIIGLLVMFTLPL
jgi:hypothetical protein